MNDSFVDFNTSDYEIHLLCNFLQFFYKDQDVN